MVSQNKHNKFRDTKGRTIIMSTSPSDVNAELAQMRDIDRIASAPPYVPPLIISRSTAALAPKLKPKAGAGSGGSSNRKVASYIKRDAPRITEERREADRLESEWMKLLQRMGSSFALLNRQMDEAFSYCCTLYFLNAVRHHSAEILREERRKDQVNKSYYLGHRSAVHATLKFLAKKEKGRTAINSLGIVPWLLHIAPEIDIALWDADDADDAKAFMQEVMRWASVHFLEFVRLPRWLGEYRLAPIAWDAGERRLMRFLPPPAGLRRMH
jgi:hypothetical protein